MTIVYDHDGRHYSKGAGLSVYLNGRQVLTPSVMGRKTIAISEPTLSTTPHPIDLAVNYDQERLSCTSASINTLTNEVYQAVDGGSGFTRMSGTTGRMKDHRLTKIGSAWISATKNSLVPSSSISTVTTRNSKRRQNTPFNTGRRELGKVPGSSSRSPGKPLANGAENTITFRPVIAAKIRILFTNPRSAAIALVEMKVFE